MRAGDAWLAAGRADRGLRLSGELFRAALLAVAPAAARPGRARRRSRGAASGIAALDAVLGDWRARAAWIGRARRETAAWNAEVAGAIAPGNAALPSDAQVLGAVNRAVGPDDTVVCAAGGLPGELHKL